LNLGELVAPDCGLGVLLAPSRAFVAPGRPDFHAPQPPPSWTGCRTAGVFVPYTIATRNPSLDKRSPAPFLEACCSFCPSSAAGPSSVGLLKPAALGGLLGAVFWPCCGQLSFFSGCPATPSLLGHHLFRHPAGGPSNPQPGVDPLLPVIFGPGWVSSVGWSAIRPHPMPLLNIRSNSSSLSVGVVALSAFRAAPNQGKHPEGLLLFATFLSRCVLGWILGA